MDWRGLRVTVFGMARSGLATIELLREAGAVLRGADLRAASEMPEAAAWLDRMGVPFVRQGPESVTGCDVAILSPGVPPDLPLFEQARAAGVRVMGDVEAACQFLRGPILGVTGSNGKTTCTALAGHLLKEGGIAAQVGGNIGTPPAAMAASSRDDQWNVLELSSFQLEMAETVRVRIAAALNVTPDHLDRHGTLEKYAAAKQRIFLNQRAEDAAVLNHENGITRGFAAQCAAQVHWFNAGGRVARGFWMEGAELVADGRAWMKAEEIPLRGRHNIENVLAAACCAHLAGVPLEALRRGVMSFPGVEHRIEFVRRVRGVDYYNDSKATNVDATIKALESFEGGLWVILGGLDKKSDYRPLRPLLEARAKAALLIGSATEIIAGHLEGSVRMERCGDLASAVALAAREAQPGDTVLLAPACASFDQFSGYEHRGRAFKQIVAGLEERG
ncbi:MAG: UDP-N-acetylmuramoyl-L-alanine--D-glutamate ligase [Bryobacteraceae bacterium]|nr:UDP-N-acetylmuramoyl-L-alanine--D-glutamate ligase [Bryobacteraceae bacterium]